MAAGASQRATGLGVTTCSEQKLPPAELPVPRCTLRLGQCKVPRHTHAHQTPGGSHSLLPEGLPGASFTAVLFRGDSWSLPHAQSQVTTAPAGTVLGRRSEPWAEASWWVPSLPPCSCLQVAAGEGLGGPPAVRGTLGNQVWSHRPLEAQDGASSGGLQSASLCFCTWSDVPATRTPVTHLTLRKPRSRAFAGGQAEAQGQRDRPWGPP